MGKRKESRWKMLRRSLTYPIMCQFFLSHTLGGGMAFSFSPMNRKISLWNGSFLTCNNNPSCIGNSRLNPCLGCSRVSRTQHTSTMSSLQHENLVLTLMDRGDSSIRRNSNTREISLKSLDLPSTYSHSQVYVFGDDAVGKGTELQLVESNCETFGFSLGYSIKDLSRIYADAVRADKLGDTKRSEILLKKLAIINSKDGRVWSRLSRLQRDNGNLVGARAVLHRALKAIPSNAHIWHGLAELEREDGHFEGARLLYARAVELNPSLSHAWDAWGRMEARLGDIPRARDLFLQGLKGDANSHRLWHAYGVSSDRLGEAKQAEWAFEKGLTITPANPYLLIAKAIMLWHAGDSVSSRVILKECIALNVRSSEAWLTLARIEEADGRIHLARSIYRKATMDLYGQKSAPPQVWQSWARMEELSGETLAAISVYSQASLIFKRNTELLISWAKLEADYLNINKARKILQHALRIDPTQSTTYQATAELEMEQGEFEKARAIFFQGVRVSAGPDGLGPLLTSWAICEWRLSKHDRARQLFEWAVRVWGNQASIGCLWQSWAALEAEAGNVDLAANYISRAVLADNQNWQAWAVWASLEKKRGAHERAKEYMSAARTFKRAEDGEAVSCKDTKKTLFAGTLNRNEDIFGIRNNFDHPLKRVFQKKRVQPLVERFRR